MDIQNNNFLSIEQVADRLINKTGTGSRTAKSDVSFESILKAKASESEGKATEVKFSKHAANRLNDRNISLSVEQLQKLNDAALKAGEKGIKESLVLMDQLAFVVNIPNNTVVTALDKSETSLNVFTNIDGAVIV
jgi:flagellar operon protein